MSSLELGIIGNCQIAALVDRRARITWCCLPQFDSNPAFCSLLDVDEPERGFYEIELIDQVRSEQQYLRNTAILLTTVYDSHGNAIRIMDFAPRYMHFGRRYHPVTLIRILAPVTGSPRVRIRLRPACDYGIGDPEVTVGSNHIRYIMPEYTARLTTDIPLTAIRDESIFILTEAKRLIFGPDEPIVDSVAQSARDSLEATKVYWQEWVRGLAIPFEWQEAVIRAAITLKLCTFEDTGAVIAAITTSVAESADSGRNWDYRYCWMRDSYYVVHALNRLGVTKTMSKYLGYISDVCINSAEDLQPVYGISAQADLSEREVPGLPGYRSMGPVRVGNQAFEQSQNDVYGAVILSATQQFFDQRLIKRGDLEQFRLLERLGEKAIQLFGQPDAGIWEFRGKAQLHTYSAMMCWCAADRLAKVAKQLGKSERMKYWERHAKRMHEEICTRAWNDTKKAFTESFDNDAMDASLLTMPSLGFLAPDDARYLSTVNAIEQELRRGNHMFRYSGWDDFGLPENAFNICTFWFIEALAAIGRTDEAREIFEMMLECRNSLGLLSEHLDPENGELWGNFPQTYSMVGIINSARILSVSWESVL